MTRGGFLRNLLVGSAAAVTLVPRALTADERIEVDGDGKNILIRDVSMHGADAAIRVTGQPKNLSIINSSFSDCHTGIHIGADNFRASSVAR